jgi:hypothetical protein
VLLSEGDIPLVLLLRVGEAVPDGEALEVHVALVAGLEALVTSDNGAGDGGNVMTSVGLTEDVEVEVLVSRILGEEPVDELMGREEVLGRRRPMELATGLSKDYIAMTIHSHSSCPSPRSPRCGRAPHRS